MKFKARRELKRTKIEIIPMIDTIFFLLVFFMLSSLSLTRINGLRVNLPEASTNPPEMPSSLTLTITADRRLLLNNAETTLEALPQRLQDEIAYLHADPKSTSFVINADATVPHGMVVRAIDDSRLVGIGHFSIATTPDAIARP
jgi:biopolymer transport protein ExbD